MQLKRITASYGRTINTGNYESLRAEATFEADLEPGDDPQEVQAILMAQAKGAVKDQVWADRETYSQDWPHR